jgi:hypothetical protein
MTFRARRWTSIMSCLPPTIPTRAFSVSIPVSALVEVGMGTVSLRIRPVSSSLVFVRIARPRALQRQMSVLSLDKTTNVYHRGVMDFASRPLAGRSIGDSRTPASVPHSQLDFSGYA